MPEDVRALTATLARDPTSLVYADLAQALRRRGQHDEALRVVLHGLARHPHHAEGHDALARIYADLGDMDRAGMAWGKVLDIAPESAAALKGVAYVRFRQQDAAAAAALLERALVLDPSDDEARRALDVVRRGTRGAGGAAAEPRAPAAETGDGGAGAPRARPAVFSGFDRATSDILLLDERGLVVAGGLAAADGGDVSEVAAAALAGVSGEATRTAEYLSLGPWRTIVAEAETANLVMAPVGAGALLLVRRDRSMPVGLALRFAERARGTALAWLEGQGA